MKEDKLSDSWCTPDDLFNVLNKGGIYQGIEFEGFNFDIDLCANEENSKCINYYEDYLTNKRLLAVDSMQTPNIDKPFGTCFMNPPYSNPKPFIEKAWEDSKYCTIVCLVKCDPSTQWWATFWNYDDVWEYNYMQVNETKLYNRAGAKPGCEVMFFPKRIKFDPPQQLIDSGEVWRLVCTGCDNKNINVPHDDVSYCRKCCNKGGKWVQKCRVCEGEGELEDFVHKFICSKCKGKGYTPLSGPNFSCALLIFDRRSI